jgi:hypothetical protein
MFKEVEAISVDNKDSVGHEPDAPGDVVDANAVQHIQIQWEPPDQTSVGFLDDGVELQSTEKAKSEAAGIAPRDAGAISTSPMSEQELQHAVAPG